MVVPPNADVDSADKYVGCNHYEPYLICPLLVYSMLNGIPSCLHPWNT